MPAGWPTLSPWLLFLAVYAVALLCNLVINRYEFRLRPEKGARYRALPMGYKLLCWFGVMPLLAGTVIHPAMALGAFVGFMLLEAACIRWYRKTGLW